MAEDAMSSGWGIDSLNFIDQSMDLHVTIPGREGGLPRGDLDLDRILYDVGYRFAMKLFWVPLANDSLIIATDYDYRQQRRSPDELDRSALLSVLQAKLETYLGTSTHGEAHLEGDLEQGRGGLRFLPGSFGVVLIRDLEHRTDDVDFFYEAVMASAAVRRERHGGTVSECAFGYYGSEGPYSRRARERSIRRVIERFDDPTPDYARSVRFGRRGEDVVGIMATRKSIVLIVDSQWDADPEQVLKAAAGRIRYGAAERLAGKTARRRLHFAEPYGVSMPSGIWTDFGRMERDPDRYRLKSDLEIRTQPETDSDEYWCDDVDGGRFFVQRRSPE